MKGIKISSRYARSLVELCKEKGQLDGVLVDMELVRDTIKSSRELSILLNSPVVKADTKVAVLNKIFGGNIGQITHGFMKLLTEKGREGYLEEVAESFVEQVRFYKDIVTAKVTTAVPLDETTRQDILAVARKISKGDIDLVETVDDSVLGGFVLRVGDQMIDTSVATSLKNMKRNFDDNPYIPEL